MKFSLWFETTMLAIILLASLVSAVSTEVVTRGASHSAKSAATAAGTGQ